MTIQVYHSGDDGLPDYSGSNSDPGAINAFKTLAIACLVDGYGSKPAAGWELIAEGSNYLVLRPGSESGYVGFQFTGSGARIWLAQTFTGMNGSVMSGDGLKTGTASNNSTPHFRSFRYINAVNSTNHAWVAVADEKTAIFNFSAQSSTGAPVEMTSSNGSNAAGLLYIGEDSRGNLIAIGGSLTTSTNTDAAYFDKRAFTALKNPATGLLVDVGSINMEITPGTMSSGQARNNGFYGVLENAVLTPMLWGSGGVWSQIRGIADVPQLSLFTASATARALGFPGPMSFGQLNTPLPLDDSHSYWVNASAGSNSPQTRSLLITDNPEFW